MPDTTQYTRVPGRSPLINPLRSSLWLGDDHLLLVSHSFIAETYRRFPLHAIQAIVITESKRSQLYNLILGISGILLLIGTLSLGMLSPWVALVPGVQLMVVCILLLINLGRGPTCRTTLRTAVQTVELGSLARLRRARATLAALTERIEAVQGQVASQHLATLQTSTTPTPATGLQATPIIISQPSHSVSTPRTVHRRTRARLHSVLFCSCLGVGFCSLTALAPGTLPFVSVLSFVLLFVVFFTGVTAGLMQIGTTLPLSVKVLTWITPAYHILTFIGAVVPMIIYTVIHFSEGNQAALTNHAAFQIFALFDFAIACLLGLAGLIGLDRYRRHIIATPQDATIDE